MPEANHADLPVNLRRLRDVKGLSQEELAEQAGLSRAGYRKLEAGDSRPRPNTIVALAKALDVKPGDLLRPAPPRPVARFRSSKRMREREMLLMRVGSLLDDYRALEAVLGQHEVSGLPRIDVRGRHGQQRAARAAADVRTAFGLDPSEPIHDICGLLEDHGVKVLRLEVKSEGFFGLSVSDGSAGPAIIVNVWDRISVERWIFTVGHELGHLLLHREDFNSETSIEVPEHEREADIFAAHLLMPNESFMKEWEQSRGLTLYERVLKLKRIYRVSYMTVLYRLSESGMSNVWGRFKAEARRRSGRPLLKADEPDGLTADEFLSGAAEVNKGQEPVQLDAYDFLGDRRQRLVREALESELISMGRAAEILGIPLREMREVAGSWY
jgi:Zn-dependent peptidase ImmA (M78 family)/DNA-binding XRE family transcriptional regulator